MKILTVAAFGLTALFVLVTIGCAYAAIWTSGDFADDLAATAFVSGFIAIPLGGAAAFLATEEI